MNPLFLYLLKSSISLAIFYGFYALIYRREAFFQFNRAFLLFALFIATALPFFNFSIFSFSGSGVQSPEELLFYTQFPAVQLNDGMVNSEPAAVDGFPFFSLVAYIYLAGVFFKTVQFLLRLKQISSISKRNENICKDGVRYVLTAKGLPVFSFFNRIFIDGDNLKNQDVEKIIEHEKIHIGQLHSVDLLLAEVVYILQWFNPFAWLLKKAIKENHEFIADRKIVSKQPDDAAYRLLLLEYASPVRTNILTHNFSYSLLKRRLQMMKKRKSITRFAFNLIWMLPVLFLVLFACSSPKGEEGVQGNVAIENGDLKDVDWDSFSVNIVVSDEGDTTFLFMPDKGGYFALGPIGGNGSLKTMLLEKAAKNRKLQKVDSDSVSVETFLRKDGGVAFFIVLGKERYLKLDILHETGTLKTLLNGRWGPDSFVRVWKSERNDIIKPGIYAYELEADHEKIIKGSFTVPERIVSEVENDSNDIFAVVEKQPEFPGGVQGLYDYLAKSVKYPEQAKQDSIVGRVFVSFVVEKDGSVSNVGLLRGIGGGCDEEAMRVVSEMPKWKPGLMSDKPVRVQFNLPIKFTLK